MKTDHLVLVVDDETSILKLTTRMLRKAGLHFDTAMEGESALKKLQERIIAGHCLKVVK